MTHIEYRRLHRLGREFIRFANEISSLGASIGDTPSHPAVRGLMAWFHAQRDFEMAVPMVADRPGSYRYPLHMIPAGHRADMLSAARLRAWRVLPRVKPLPLPR